MGDVFKGYDAELDRYVAIKVSAAGIARQEDALNRFRAEAAAAAKVEHCQYRCRFIPSAMTEDGHSLHAICGRQTLSKFLAEQPTVPLETTLRIVEQVVSGLGQHAWDWCWDYRPGNIFDGWRAAKRWWPILGW
jgi:serine/threonine-protein kinase